VQTTQLDPDTRTRAYQVLAHRGALDLAPMLGLTDSPTRRRTRRARRDGHQRLAVAILAPGTAPG
jgi:tRNA-dihydrouridine synthase